MYEIYQRLLDEKGLKNADVARATGISNMTLSDFGTLLPLFQSDNVIFDIPVALATSAFFNPFSSSNFR